MIVVPQLGRSLCDGLNIDGGFRAIRGLRSSFKKELYASQGALAFHSR
jgi:hypothetical protein